MGLHQRHEVYSCSKWHTLVYFDAAHLSAVDLLCGVLMSMRVVFVQKLHTAVLHFLEVTFSFNLLVFFYYFLMVNCGQMVKTVLPDCNVLP